jgi:hypothetical protein
MAPSFGIIWRNVSGLSGVRGANLAIFAQRLEKVKLAVSAALGGVGHPRLGSPMGLLVNASIN